MYLGMLMLEICSLGPRGGEDLTARGGDDLEVRGGDALELCLGGLRMF